MKTDNLRFKASPNLDTERLLLRKLSFKDAGAIYKYGSDPEVTRFMLWETHRSINDTYNFIEFILEQYNMDTAAEWVITLKNSGEVVGTIGLNSLSRHFCCELGYTLSKDYWGQGIMPEAASKVLQFAFEDMKVNRVESMHFVGNEKSGRVMQKIGMKYEGCLRKKIFAKGKYHDCAIYSKLAQEHYIWR